MAFNLRDAEEFDRFISALATDVISAHIHLTLIHDIWQASRKYEREFAQSPTFWALTAQAHLSRQVSAVWLGPTTPTTRR